MAILQMLHNGIVTTGICDYCGEPCKTEHGWKPGYPDQKRHLHSCVDGCENHNEVFVVAYKCKYCIERCPASTIEEALAFIKRYTEYFGPEEYNGHPEWEVYKLAQDDLLHPGMYQVRCYQVEKVGNNDKAIWINGFDAALHKGQPWWAWHNKPDFKQTWLFEGEVVLLANDLLEEVLGDGWENFFDDEG